jgi:hypothetical protein
MKMQGGHSWRWRQQRRRRGPGRERMSIMPLQTTTKTPMTTRRRGTQARRMRRPPEPLPRRWWAPPWGWRGGIFKEEVACLKVNLNIFFAVYTFNLFEHVALISKYRFLEMWLS